MASLKREFESLSIVLIGSFNPAIYQPAWLGHMGLLRDEEVKNAKVEVVHPEISSITIGTIKIQVQSQRFLGITENPGESEVLRDLVVGIFKILPHTPAYQLGLNSDTHFNLDSEKNWHGLGHRLAPKEPWKGVFTNPPGMRSLTMEGRRDDGRSGYVRIKIEPSLKIKHGVLININDHYEIPEYKPENGCEAIIDILTSSWNDSLKRSQLTSAVLLGS
jgi:hypothetical protein